MIITLTKEYGVYLDKDYNSFVAYPTEVFYPPYRPYFLDFLGTVVATTPKDAIRIYKENNKN